MKILCHTDVKYDFIKCVFLDIAGHFYEKLPCINSGTGAIILKPLFWSRVFQVISARSDSLCLRVVSAESYGFLLQLLTQPAPVIYTAENGLQ